MDRLITIGRPQSEALITGIRNILLQIHTVTFCYLNVIQVRIMLIQHAFMAITFK